MIENKEIVFARDEEGYIGIYLDGKCKYQHDSNPDPERLLNMLGIKYITKYVDNLWLYDKDRLPENIKNVEWSTDY